MKFSIKQAPLNSSDGYTLLEVIVALVVFGLLVMGIPSAFTAQTKFNSRNEIRGGAMAAAQQKLDGLRLIDVSSMRTSGSDSEEDIQVGDRTFQVRTIYCGQTTYCGSATRHIEVKALYRGQQFFSVETVYTQLR